MNKRIKKKQIKMKEKRITKMCEAIRRIAKICTFSSVPQSEFFERQSQFIKDAYRKAFEDEGYVVEDVKIEPDGIVSTKLLLKQ